MSSSTSLSSLPLESLTGIAVYLPVPSRLNLTTTCRSLHRIRGAPSVWQYLDLSSFGASFGDEQFDELLDDIAGLVRAGDGGASQLPVDVLSLLRHVVLDRTGVMMWTVSKLLLQRTIVSLSIRNCPNVTMEDLDELTDLRRDRRSGFMGLVPLSSAQSQLRHLRLNNLANHAPQDEVLPAEADLIDFTIRIRFLFPNLLSVVPSICLACERIIPDREMDGLRGMAALRTGHIIKADLSPAEYPPLRATFWCYRCAMLKTCSNCLGFEDMPRSYRGPLRHAVQVRYCVCCSLNGSYCDSCWREVGDPECRLRNHAQVEYDVDLQNVHDAQTDTSEDEDESDT